MLRITISRMKSVKSVHRPSTYDKRLNIRKNADKKHRIVRKEHVLPGERTIMFNMNQPMTDDIDPYKSACVSRCNMCGIPISEYLLNYLNLKCSKLTLFGHLTLYRNVKNNLVILRLQEHAAHLSVHVALLWQALHPTPHGHVLSQVQGAERRPFHCLRSASDWPGQGPDFRRGSGPRNGSAKAISRSSWVNGRFDA